MSEAASFTNGNDPMTPPPTGSTPGDGSQKTNAQPAAPAKPSTGDVYRDAMKRLAAGEKPKDINRDVYQGGTADKKKDDAAEASQAAPESEETDDQPGEPAAAEPGDTRGLSTKELNALKRGKINVADAHWKSVPASNIKAIAKNLMESQAAADRAYQANKTGANKPPAKPGEQQQQQPGQRSSADQGQQQTGQQPTDAGDAGAGEDAADAAGNEAPTQEPGNQSVTSTADFFQPLPKMDAKTRATLVEIGGEGLATQIEARDQALYQQTMTQFAPMVRGFQAITSMLERRDIEDGFTDLGKDAAYANLTPQQRKSVEAKAAQLLRASDQPLGSYGFRQAIGEAARIVLSTNVSQAAQAKLLTQRAASVRGSPDKGNSRTNASPKALTGPQLAKAVGDLMKQGKTAKEARAMLEAGNAA